MKIETLKQKEREARRRLILDAALRRFAVKEFHTVNVREIAKEAGVSIGTIYNYYADLDALFLDIFLKGAREITRLLAMEDESHPTLKRLCEIYISYLNRNMTFYQMMGHFMLSGSLSAEATEKLNQTMRSLMDRIEEMVRAAGFEKETRALSHSLFSALQ